VLFGEDDQLVNPRLAARAVRTFRNARVEVLPETGHIAQMEHPDLVARLFREMVAEARATGAANPAGDRSNCDDGTGNSGRRDPVDA